MLKQLTYNVILVIIDIVFQRFFIYKFLIIGAALATAVTTLIGLIIVILFTINKIDIRLPIFSIIRINVISFSIFGLLNIILSNFFANHNLLIPLVIFIETIIYLILLFIFNDFNLISEIKYLHKRLNYNHNNK